MSKTTEPGYINRHGQINLGPTSPPCPGNDHNQIIYVMRCIECGTNYGANGSDIFQRKCPEHQGGATGLTITDIEVS